MTPLRRAWRRVGAFYDKYGDRLTTMVAVALAAWAVYVAEGNSSEAGHSARVAKAAAFAAQRAVRAIEVEATQRRDESCRIFETKQKADVDALERTYRYLAGLPKGKLEDPLNKALLAQLPTTIRDAQTDDAPSYCDDPGIGLPEPDPVLPKRPPNVPAPK